MTTSQNGWPAGPNREDADIQVFTVPGTLVRLPLNKDAGPMLIDFAADFNNTVQKLNTTDCWGYDFRPIRGTTTTISNHGSGTAMDLDANEHPLATPDLATYTAQQVAQIHHLLLQRGGVIRWGGDYQTRLDSMHFEINVPPGQFHSLAPVFNTPPFPGVLHLGQVNGHVYTLRLKLIRLGVHMALNSTYDTVCVAAVSHFQSTHGLTVDGVVGPATWAALWSRT